METTIETTTKRVGKFIVEADAARNGTIILQSIPGTKLRSTLRPDRPSINWLSEGKEEVSSSDQTKTLGMFGVVPGQRLEVNPGDCTYRIFDPINEDEKILRRLERAMKTSDRFLVSRGMRLKGYDEVQGTLDQHRMKTLCREILRIIENGDMRLIKGGASLTQENVDALPGKYLLNPGSTVQNTQPRFEEDYEAWLENLNRQGG